MNILAMVLSGLALAIACASPVLAQSTPAPAPLGRIDDRDDAVVKACLDKFPGLNPRTETCIHAGWFKAEDAGVEAEASACETQYGRNTQRQMDCMAGYGLQRVEDIALRLTAAIRSEIAAYASDTFRKDAPARFETSLSTWRAYAEQQCGLEAPDDPNEGAGAYLANTNCRTGVAAERVVRLCDWIDADPLLKALRRSKACIVWRLRN